jgi:hypothetical protein
MAQSSTSGGWVKEVHNNHEAPCNPFEFDEHRKLMEDILEQRRIATIYRQISLPWFQASKLLEQETSGLLLTSREYYNLTRN